MDGKEVAAKIRKDVSTQVAAYIKQYNRRPCLAVLIVGDDEGSKVYVRNKQRACDEVGIKSHRIDLPARTPDISGILKAWKNDNDIDGILVQLPLPNHINLIDSLNAIPVEKDVDGFNAHNLGLIMQKGSGFVPCTPLAVMRMLEHYEIPLSGKSVAIVNNTVVLGRPLAELLMDSATVTVCHAKTQSLTKILQNSDIIVSAVGKRPHFSITADMVRPDAVVIDVGFNRIDGKMLGDVDYEQVHRKTKWVTKVPGGIGACTIEVLLENTIKAAFLRKS